MLVSASLKPPSLNVPSPTGKNRTSHQRWQSIGTFSCDLEVGHGEEFLTQLAHPKPHYPKYDLHSRLPYSAQLAFGGPRTAGAAPPRRPRPEGHRRRQIADPTRHPTVLAGISPFFLCTPYYPTSTVA